MPSVSKLLGLMGPAGLIVQALLASLAAVVGLLIFILLRRGARRVYFWRRDRRVLEARADWNAIVDGTIPPKAWVLSRMSREIVEGILLDRLEVASPKEAQDCWNVCGLAGYWMPVSMRRELRVVGAGTKRCWPSDVCVWPKRSRLWQKGWTMPKRNAASRRRAA